MSTQADTGTTPAAKRVGNIGLLLYSGPLWGLLGTVIGMMRAFDTLASTGSPSPDELAGDISVAILTSLIGLLIGLVGLVMILIAQHGLKNRVPSFYRNALLLSAVWCLFLFPYGSLIGVPMLVLMFIQHRKCLDDSQKRKGPQIWKVLVIILIGVLLMFVRFTCAGGFKRDAPSMADLDAEMERLFSVGFPNSASEVDGDIVILLTYVTDIEFSCSESDFETFWASSPRLSSEKAYEDVDLDPRSNEPDFEGDWESGGGVQSCELFAYRVAGRIRVVVRATHEERH